MKILTLHSYQDVSADSTKALLNIVSQSKRYGITVGVLGRRALNKALNALYIIPYINLNFRFPIFPNKRSLWQILLLVRCYIAGIRLAWYARKYLLCTIRMENKYCYVCSI